MWFQVEKGYSPLHAGICLLALILSTTTASFGTGWLVTRFGQYVPPMYAGGALLTLGAGLTISLHADSGSNMWAPFLVIAGLGFGAGLGSPQTAAQAVLAPADISLGVALVILCQLLGSSTFIALGGALLKNGIVDAGAPAGVVSTAGAGDLRSSVPPGQLQAVLDAYASGFRGVFACATALAGVSLLAAAGMEWRSIKQKK